MLTIEQRVEDILAVSGPSTGITPADARILAEREMAEGRVWLRPQADMMAELSENLARYADEAEETLRARGVEVNKRCASCAFTRGTFPNTKAPLTGLDALKCIKEEHPFGCHHGKGADGQPTRLCGAFANILLAGAGPKREACPWGWSDELGEQT